MSTNVGAIDLDLVLNSNKFNKQLKNVEKQATSTGNVLQGTLGKIGKIAAAALSVTAIVKFGKECINLGSDLAEVQNVVDVSFPKMNEQVNAFAENAIEQFGLGQTVAKKYMGTFGAMAKAFKFSEQESYNMAAALTGLAGDVASFYNMSSDEAYTKLKSVFTGETETLKELGVVMTQNALDQYALANGFGKTTAKMTEQEKVALRMKFVTEQLSLASGDFVRTQDSWANQTRILSLRFNELKATLGQAFINVLNPVVKGINYLISKLQVLANAFKSFTEFITGKKSDTSGGLGQTASDIASLTDSANNAEDAVSGIGSSAKKAKKQLQGLRGIDEINNLTTSNDSNSDSGSAGGSAGSFDFGGSLAETTSEANNEFGKLNGYVQELFKSFKKGFKDAFGSFDFNGFKGQIDSIGNSLKEIFSSPEVQGAAKKWANSLMFDLGAAAGLIGSVGVTIADNLVGGISLFLEQNKKNIQDHIVRMFDISARSHELSGKFSITVADIFSVFRGKEAKQVTANIIGIFTEGYLGVVEVTSTFANDVFYMITEPFNRNKNLIKKTLTDMFSPLSKVLGTIKKGIEDTFSKFWEVYDQYIRPAVENITNGFTSILETVLNTWNNNIKPILDEWAVKFDELWVQHIQPMIDSFLEYMGKLINGLSELWNTWLVPLINWIIENVVPAVAPVIKEIGNTVMTVFGKIGDILKGFWDALSGIIDFIVGIFTGDWEKAWNGVKEIFSGIWQMIKGIFSGIWEAIKGIVKTAIEAVKGVIQTALNAIKSVWEKVWNGIKSFGANIWNGIKNTFSGVGSWFSSKFQEAYNGITRVFSNVGNFLGSIWNKVKNTFSALGTNIGNAISNAVKSGINGVISLIERTINSAIGLINGGIDLINLIPGVWVGHVPTLNLPRLAQGGYVKANTPQLAMIGDNRHQGEVVAPENKLHEIMAEELSKFQGAGGNSDIVKLLREILTLLKNLGGDTVLKINDVELARAVIRGMKLLQSKSDKPILDFI